MITKLQRRALQSAIRALVKAEVADSWKGGGYPGDITISKQELRDAKLALNQLLDDLTEPDDASPRPKT